MQLALIILSGLVIVMAGIIILHQRRCSAADADFQSRIEKEKEISERLRYDTATLSASIESLEKTLERERADNSRLTQANSALTAEVAALRERDIILREEREQQEIAATERFKNLANEIFKNHTAVFKQSSEQRLEEIISPLKTNLDDFRKAVNSAYSDEAKERFSLRNEIRNLMELNKTIGKEAQELTRALKGDSKIQGDWGEMILERLLEMSGLQKDYHFKTQMATNSDGKRLTSEQGQGLRPDVVVFYPDDRCVVIDSKVSLSAYIAYVNAAPESPDLKDAAKRHLLSVRRHIDELAQKRYQDLVGEKRLDFVMMFIPNEGAYLATMKLDAAIWQEAFNKRVLLTSPTHLISILKMLEQLWKQDSINKNVQEIARLSGTMIDKIASFINDLDDINKALASADSACEKARKHLAEGNGNVLVTARKIVRLGAKASKSDRLRQLSTESDIAE